MLVVNTTFRLAPWADALFAMDRQWWDMYAREVRQVFRGERFTSSAAVTRHGLRKLPRFKPFGNSGAGAIALADKFGAARATLLGYDMQRTGGMVHWHGNHPKGLGNAGSMPKWPQQFTALRLSLRGLQVVNATRQTALTAFPRATLEECLARPQQHVEQPAQLLVERREEAMA